MNLRSIVTFGIIGIGALLFLIALGKALFSHISGKPQRDLMGTIVLLIASGVFILTGTMLNGSSHSSEKEPRAEPEKTSPPGEPAPGEDSSSWQLPRVENTETLWLIPIALAVLILLVWIIRMVSTAVRRHRQEASQLRASRETAQKRWGAVIRRHDDLRQKILHAETDWDTLFSMPALQDVSDPMTSKLYLAMQRASDEAAEMPEGFKAASSLADFAYPRAVDELDLAWQSAWANAKKIGVSLIPEEEKKLIRTIQRTLRLAQDTAATQSERHLAYERVESMLAQLKHVAVPPRAIGQIEEARRPMIEATTL